MEGGGWRVEDGERRMDAGEWRVEAGGGMLEVGGWRVESGRWKVGWRVEDRMEDGRWKGGGDYGGWRGGGGTIRLTWVRFRQLYGHTCLLYGGCHWKLAGGGRAVSVVATTSIYQRKLANDNINIANELKEFTYAGFQYPSGLH